MPDMLNTAVSSLLAFQRALGTTSHNIANVNTPGYSRQTTEIGTQAPSFFGGVFFGSGVQIEGIRRAYDQFLVRDMRESTSAHSRAAMLAGMAGQIDDVLADPQGGITPILHDFFEAVQAVADDPASSTTRFAMIHTAEALASRFQNISSRFEIIQRSTNDQIRNTVDEINLLVGSIRDINITLHNMSSLDRNGQQAADLLDERDQLLLQLSEKVDISVVNEQDSQLSIFIGNGQAVLTGTEAFTLSAQPSAADPNRDVIAYNGLITVLDISGNLTGGEIGGLLEFRDQVLDQTLNALGRTAIGLAETFNSQMRDGMDLNGNLGQDFFSYSPPQSIPFSSNTGTPTVSTVVSDVTALTTDDYQLSFDGVNWTLTSDSGTSATVANGAPATLTFEGITLTINGATAVAGDQFTIRPTLGGAGSLQVLTTDPNEIAAALPIRTNASLSNLGNVEISAGIVTDVTDPALLNPATFTFDTPPTTLRADVAVVVGGVPYAAGAAIPYSNNMVIDANGWQVSLNGTPQAGDVLTVEANIGGTGDNRNVLNLAGLQHNGIFNGGAITYQEDYAALVGFVGSQAFTANVESDANQSLLFQARDRLAAKASVNLDEEAADLVRFQQAYEASARIINTVQVMFESLLSSLR